MLRISLFGAPRVEYNGQPIVIGRNKSVALLAYLALSGQAQQRDALLGLLWPEFDGDSARNNLRRELSLLRSALGEQAIVADRAQVSWNALAGSLDVSDFRERLALRERHGHAPGELCPACAQALAGAAELYRDDLLAGFGLPDSPAFDEWQFFQREGLRQQLASVLRELVQWYGDAGDHDRAVQCARRWLALDRLHEPAQRALMRAYALAGQPSAALRQYEESARLLTAELGAAPEAATTELYNQIRARAFASQGDTRHETRDTRHETRDTRHETRDSISPSPPLASPPLASPPLPLSPAAPRGALPAQATSFVGREQELAALESYCASPHIRMITIVGAGGMGKTRLAIELASRQRGAYADGVRFAALQAVGNATQLIAAIAEAACCSLTSAEPPCDQLLSYLRTKQLLLVLDNIEHLLSADDGVAGLLAEIYATAPGVRLLITSREVLNMQEEWCFPLEGLAVPPPGADEPPDRSDAVRCFVERARRARPDFDWQREGADVARICRLVEGMPLAIELAAAWTASLSCKDIAAEIERGLGFLTTRLRNVPDRHRSVRATLDYSWSLLTEQQRAVFARLSAFHNGFVPPAAARVAGATLEMLATFVDKSLLQNDRDGRYRLHELLRQYAAEQLAASAGAVEAARRAHADYFVALLRQHFDNVTGAGQLQAMREIGAEIDNIRLAWQYIVGADGGAGDADAIEAAHHVLAFFYEVRCMYHEGLSAFQAAARALRSGALTPARAAPLAGLLVDQAALMLHLGQIAQAKAALEESEALYAQFGLPLPPGQTTDPLYWLGIVAHIEGDFAATARLGERARRRSEQAGHAGNLGPSCYLLTLAAITQGQWRAAQRYAEQAYAAVNATQDRWSLAHCHHHLANALVELGAYEEANAHYRAAYEIAEAFEQRQGMAIALLRLGRVALRQADYPVARALYERSLLLLLELGDPGGEAEAHHGLGRAALGLGELAEARRQLSPALRLSAKIGWALQTLRICITVAELLIETEQPELGVAVLIVVLRHPATDRAAGDRAQRALLRAEDVLPPDTFASAERYGQRLDLDTVVARLRATLATPEPPRPLVATAQDLVSLARPCGERHCGAGLAYSENSATIMKAPPPSASGA